MLRCPVALLGAGLGTMARGFDNNIYTQIGLVLLIGLSAKNAILIVEFAKQRVEDGGLSARDAAVEGSSLRFRAILMTALSFLLGVIPLVVASGAGAASRVSLGTAVFGGMLLATVIGIFFIPMLYVLVAKLFWSRAVFHGKLAGDPAQLNEAEAMVATTAAMTYPDELTELVDSDSDSEPDGEGGEEPDDKPAS